MVNRMKVPKHIPITSSNADDLNRFCFISYFNGAKSIELANLLNVSREMIKHRIKRGWREFNRVNKICIEWDFVIDIHKSNWARIKERLDRIKNDAKWERIHARNAEQREKKRLKEEARLTRKLMRKMKKTYPSSMLVTISKGLTETELALHKLTCQYIGQKIEETDTEED